MLAHASGLHNAISVTEKVCDLCDWSKMIQKMEDAEPEGVPGDCVVYHALSYGWLLGGLVEKVKGRLLNEVIRSYITEPLGIVQEFYMCTGLPDEVLADNGRFAKLFIGVGGSSGIVDVGDLMAKLDDFMERRKEEREGDSNVAKSDGKSVDDLKGRLRSGAIHPLIFNMRSMRKANIPAANGHCSARALAKFYAALICEENKTRYNGNVILYQRTLDTIHSNPNAHPASHVLKGTNASDGSSQQGSMQGFAQASTQGRSPWLNGFKEITLMHNLQVVLE